LDKMAFVSGPDAVRQEVEQALAATNGRRHILAPTCVVPSQASAEALGVVKRTMNDER
jgi:hypothetical protein